VRERERERERRERREREEREKRERRDREEIGKRWRKGREFMETLPAAPLAVSTEMTPFIVRLSIAVRWIAPPPEPSAEPLPISVGNCARRCEEEKRERRI